MTERPIGEVIAELRGLLAVTSPTALATGAVRHDHATCIMHVLPRLLDLAERASVFHEWFTENQQHLDALGDLLGTCEGINPLPFAVKRLTRVERLEAERDRLREAIAVVVGEDRRSDRESPHMIPGWALNKLRALAKLDGEPSP